MASNVLLGQPPPACVFVDEVPRLSNRQSVLAPNVARAAEVDLSVPPVGARAGTATQSYVLPESENVVRGRAVPCLCETNG